MIRVFCNQCQDAYCSSRCRADLHVKHIMINALQKYDSEVLLHHMSVLSIMEVSGNSIAGALLKEGFMNFCPPTLLCFLRGCIMALVAFAGHGPGVSLRAGARRFTRHLSTTLGLADCSTTGSSTLPSFLSSPTPRTLSLLCSILLPV